MSDRSACPRCGGAVKQFEAHTDDNKLSSCAECHWTTEDEIERAEVKAEIDNQLHVPDDRVRCTRVVPAMHELGRNKDGYRVNLPDRVDSMTADTVSEVCHRFHNNNAQVEWPLLNTNTCPERHCRECIHTTVLMMWYHSDGDEHMIFKTVCADGHRSEREMIRTL